MEIENKEKVILALDPSTKSTGWAIFLLLIMEL